MEIKKNTAAVVLAGGSGSRMNSRTKKQYMQIQGKPLIYYSLAAFEKSIIEKVVLVCSPGDEQYCKENIVDKYGLHKVVAIVSGGKERYNSVFEGLKALALNQVESALSASCKDAGLQEKPDNTGYVLIHDGARPFVTPQIIERAYETAVKYRACVVGMPSKDTVKIADENGFVSTTPKRSLVWNVQTPQAFEFSLVYNAYKKIIEMTGNCDNNVENGCSNTGNNKTLEITDDAMVVEYTGGVPVKLVEGSYSNIKITTIEDLKGIEEYKFE